MVDICSDIAEVKSCFGILVHKYAKLAIFGNERELLFYDILRMSSYLDAMERYVNTLGVKRSKVIAQGQKVSFSSLRKQNNTLILDSEHLHAHFKIEYRPCLSDEEICKIVERAKLMCYNCS